MPWNRSSAAGPTTDTRTANRPSISNEGHPAYTNATLNRRHTIERGQLVKPNPDPPIPANTRQQTFQFDDHLFKTDQSDRRDLLPAHLPSNSYDRSDGNATKQNAFADKTFVEMEAEDIGSSNSSCGDWEARNHESIDASHGKEFNRAGVSKVGLAKYTV